MSSLMEKIQDDMEEYVLLCEHFGEKPKTRLDFYGNEILDCYGKHAEKLTNRKEEGSQYEAKTNSRNLHW